MLYYTFLYLWLASMSRLHGLLVILLLNACLLIHMALLQFISEGCVRTCAYNRAVK